MRVQMDEEDYRLVGPGGEEGELVVYGQPAALAVGEAIYYAVVGAQGEAATVYRVDSVSVVESEGQEVAFEFPDEDEDEDYDEDGDEEEEEDGDEDGDGDEAGQPDEDVVVIDEDGEGEGDDEETEPEGA